MASIGFTFDASQVDPSSPRDVIPAGKYNVQIINSEMRDTKRGDGKFLWMELEIIDGPHARQHLFDRLNLVNANPQAQEIAQRALSAICHAIGKLQVSDSEQLHFQPLAATVKVKPATEQYAASNEIGGYGPIGGAATAPAVSRPYTAPAPAASAPVANAGAATPPWRKKVA